MIKEIHPEENKTKNYQQIGPEFSMDYFDNKGYEEEFLSHIIKSDIDLKDLNIIFPEFNESVESTNEDKIEQVDIYNSNKNIGKNNIELRFKK